MTTPRELARAPRPVNGRLGSVIEVTTTQVTSRRGEPVAESRVRRSSAERFGETPPGPVPAGELHRLPGHPPAVFRTTEGGTVLELGDRVLSLDAPPLDDAWFGGIVRSPDGRHVAWVASPPSQGQEDRRDWGETYDGIRAPTVYVVEVSTGLITTVVGPQSAGQPVWRSATELVFVGWDLPRHLGIRSCGQRASRLWSHELGAPASVLTTAPEDACCRSPRVAADGTLYWLSREANPLHGGSVRLRHQPPGAGASTLVDLGSAAFPGLTTQDLPPRPFEGADHLLVTTQWGVDRALLRVHRRTGAWTRIEPPRTCAASALTVLDVRGDASLCTFETPAHAPSTWLLKGGDWTLLAEPELPDAAFTVTTLTTGGVETMLLLPPGERPPLVLFAHGGPHSASTGTHAVGPRALAEAGFAVALVNYRGSTGYGEAALTALPGRIGQIDVDDALGALEAVLAAGLADPERLAFVGGSHGGFVGAHLTGHPDHADRFRAAVLRNPVIDLPSMLLTSDIEDWVLVEGGIGTPEQQVRAAAGDGLAALGRPLSVEELTRLHEASPLRRAPEVQAATLLLLGGSDRRVPPSQGRAWAQGLAAVGATVRTLAFPDAGHALADPGVEEVVWEETLTWLKLWL